MCTGICGATSLSFKGAMKAERFGLITSILTLNGLNFSASCDEGEEKKTWSPSNERLNHKSWEWERGKGEWEWDKKKKKKRRGNHSGGEPERFKEYCQPLAPILDSSRIRRKLGVIRLSALWCVCCVRETKLPGLSCLTLYSSIPTLARITVR